MKSYLLHFLPVLFITLISCQNRAQEEEIISKILKTELSSKLEVWNTWGDSLRVYVYIPIEYSLKNNFNSEIRLSTTYWSKEKANISDAPTYQLKDNKLKIGPNKVKFSKEESKKFKVFVRFVLQLTTDEIKQIFNQEFVQKKKYDVELSTGLKTILTTQIPVKGYVHSMMYNLNSKNGFSIDIPFNF